MEVYCPRCKSCVDAEFLTEVKQIDQEKDKAFFRVYRVYHCYGCITTWTKVIDEREIYDTSHS